MCADKTPEETPMEETEETPPEETVSEDKPAAADKSTTADKPKKSRRWMLWVALVIAVFITAAIPYWFTRNSSACGQCHSMEKYYSSWQKSWHGKNETPCMDCHVKPGAFGENLYRFLFYRELFAELLGKELQPWGATVPGEAACTRDGCHSLNRLSSTAGDIKIDHAVHIKVVEKKFDKACSYCHAGASHEGIKGLGSQLPPRQQCFLAGCHKTEAKKCDLCHTVKFKPGTVPKNHI
jgi:hypothetical protein